MKAHARTLTHTSFHACIHMYMLTRHGTDLHGNRVIVFAYENLAEPRPDEVLLVGVNPRFCISSPSP